MTIALFPVPTPHHLYKLPSLSTYPSSFSNLTVPLCSPSSSTSVSVIEEEEEGPPPSPSSAESGCKACGRLEVEKGCNGEGRIQGGIATVPGFGWWPIKAYRPCPGFVASGGRYKRQGQSMDEVVSGGASPQTPSSPSTATDSKPSSKPIPARILLYLIPAVVNSNTNRVIPKHLFITRLYHLFSV